ncbi:hypothetical protein Dsin_029313 [Dipteronia sinensis]|uniref:Uncharacterized protein n=1 Tax=Dipteronia sinensis TaxID=43782 RepID=A0AAD9ZSE6_9ROSI|nr:hypothetical protein Dsin_029313 [Dipteronia sinensis]
MLTGIRYGFGASFVTLFCAELVQKVEQVIPEYDPRNRAVISDLLFHVLLWSDDAPQETFLLTKEFSFISFNSSFMHNLMILFDSSKLFATLEEGDNVSKCAAQGADLFERTEIISAMILGGTMAQPRRIES